MGVSAAGLTRASYRPMIAGLSCPIPNEALLSDTPPPAAVADTKSTTDSDKTPTKYSLMLFEPRVPYYDSKTIVWLMFCSVGLFSDQFFLGLFTGAWMAYFSRFDIFPNTWDNNKVKGLVELMRYNPTIDVVSKIFTLCGGITHVSSPEDLSKRDSDEKIITKIYLNCMKRYVGLILPTTILDDVDNVIRQDNLKTSKFSLTRLFGLLKYQTLPLPDGFVQE